MRKKLLVLAAIGLLAVPAASSAATLEPIGGSFTQPIFVTSDPQDANRLFVVERLGHIQQLQNGVQTEIADISSTVACGSGCAGERGLLSMAVPPDFDTTGLFYVDYAANDTGLIHVAEMRLMGSSAATSATLRNVITIPHDPGPSNHNGGQLQFGPDGDLYISVGDGASSPNGQNRDTTLGKILRIDPRQSGGAPYTVPADNPFVGGAGADEIWAYGLRNPWRVSFDLTTGDMYIGDVGEGSYEEVDYAPKAAGLGRGANYGWTCREGLHAHSNGDPACGTPQTFTDPIFEYPHTDPGTGAAHGCAITGGYVARDQTLGDLYGRYVYADLCQGEVRSFVPGFPASGDRSEGLHVSNPVSFGEDCAGRLYIVPMAGPVSRFVGSGSPNLNCPPPPSQAATTVTLTAPGAKRSSTSVDFRAGRLVVPFGKRVKLRAKVSPCDGRGAQRVKLLRGKRRISRKKLNGNCVVRFKPRIRRLSRFRAKVGETDLYTAGISKRLTIAPRG